MLEVVTWAAGWAGVAAAGVTATLFADQQLSSAATPTSVLAAFIAVSVSAIGLLGWVLKEQTAIIRHHAEALTRLRAELSRLRRALGQPDEEEP